MMLSRLVLALGATTFVFLGLWSLARPEQVAGIVDLGLATPTARADFMSLYGGFELGFGAFLLWAVRRSDRLAAGLVALGIALLGAGVGRLLGMLTASGPVSPLITAFLVSELGGAALSGFCVRRLRAPGAAFPA